MHRTFETTTISFNGGKCAAMTIADCFRLIHDGEAVAIVLDLLAPEEREAWWYDSGFPETAVPPRWR